VRTPLSDAFGLDLSLFAFSYMPDVVIEVCKAGGMGVLGAVRFTPDELSEAIEYVEARIGGRPYGVDIVMPAKTEAVAGMEMGELHDMLDKMIPQEHRDFVERLLEEHGVPKLPADVEPQRDLLSWNDTEARQQVERSLDRPDVKILVNALGPPPKDVVDQAHEAGVKVGTAARSRPWCSSPRSSKRCPRRPCSPPAASAADGRRRPRSPSERRACGPARCGSTPWSAVSRT
jgi:hypothetical protein